jgi:hypothetical protein
MVRAETLTHLIDPISQKKFRFLQARVFYLAKDENYKEL